MTPISRPKTYQVNEKSTKFTAFVNRVQTPDSFMQKKIAAE